jgi:hypothetical protein
LDKVKVIFLNSLPNDKSGTCIFYDYNIYRLSNWDIIDISEICRKHQEEWSNSLWEWHCNLTSAAAIYDKFAWLMPGSRIHLWQTYVKTVVFSLGLKIYLESSKEKELYIIGAPEETILFLQDITDDSFIILNKLSHSFKSINELFHVFYLRLRIVGSIILRWRPFSWKRLYKYNCDVLVFSLFLTSNSIKFYNDHFFGKVFDSISNRVFWLYKPSGRFKERTARKSLSKLKGQYEFDYNILKIWDLIWCFKHSFIVNKQMRKFKKKLPILKIDNKYCNSFSIKYFEKHFIDPICFSELSLFRSTQLLLRYVKPNVICFPYEEKGLERAIILAAKNCLPKIKVVGFAHSAYNSAWLYLGEHNKFPSLPRPDIIWAAGNGFNSWLQIFWKRFDTVVNVGTHRYLIAPHKISKSNFDSKLHILIVVGNPSELYVFRDWLINFPELLKNCFVTIRPHPQGWHAENLRIGNELKKLGISRIDNKSKLINQLDLADLVLYCSSSAVVEAIQNDNLVARVTWDELWCADPLRSGSNHIRNCNTPQQLNDLINEVISMPTKDLINLKKNQRQLADSIYSKFNPIEFNKLFD